MAFVSVLMPTYNHEKYISEAIQSFINQKVDFEIELLIGNDCSKDSTYKIAEQVIKQNYDPLKKIFLFDYSENKGLMNNYKYLLGKATGKYIAILESDDIWNDNLKLKKQIDLLENNSSLGLVYSDYYGIDEKSDTKGLFKPPLVSSKELLTGNPIAAVSVCFRRSLFDHCCNIDDYLLRKFQTFDYPVWLSLLFESDCSKINEPLVSYRRIDSSISNSKSRIKRVKFEKSIFDIRFYILKKYRSRLTFIEYMSVIKYSYISLFRVLLGL